MTGFDLSCRDWRERLKAGRSLVPDLPIDMAEGDRAVAVFKKLRLADVPGTPALGDAGGQWFFDIVRALFGSLDPVTKARAIRELFLLVPKKNSKTTNGALMMLTALLLNQRPRAPFLLTAPVQRTADEAFSAIAGAIALDPVLEAKLHVRDHLKVVVHRETQARLEIATFDPAMMTGKKVVGALVDEEHVLGKMPRADKAMLQLRGGMQPFPEAFLAIITTQSDETPAGVFADDLKKAREVRDGKRQSAILPVLYEFPPEVQTDPAKPWMRPDTWHMVTPNVGRSISIDRLAADFEDEAAKGEKALRLWASQHLNVEIGLAMHADGWAGAEYWQQQADASITLDEIIRRCDVVVVGIDGGGSDDLYGLTAIGRVNATEQMFSWSRAWFLQKVLERRKDIASRLQDFCAAGEATMVEKIEEACEEVVEIIKRIDSAGRLGSLNEGQKRAIGVDPACIKQTLKALNDAGYTNDEIVAVRQGSYFLNSAIKSTELYLASGTLSHADQGLMDWCVGNAKVETKGNAVIVTKQISGTAKIDPLAALFNAMDVMGSNPTAGTVIGADYEFTVA